MELQREIVLFVWFKQESISFELIRVFLDYLFFIIWVILVELFFIHLQTYQILATFDEIKRSWVSFRWRLDYFQFRILIE